MYLRICESFNSAENCVRKSQFRKSHKRFGPANRKSELATFAEGPHFTNF
jgi:hypothetical protein